MKETYSPQNWKKRKTINKTSGQPVWKRKTGNTLFFLPKFSSKSLTKFLTYGLIGFFIIGLITYFVVSKDLPDPNKLINREVAESTKIYDRTGQTILYEIHGDQKRTMVGLNDIPKYVKDATIAIEDKDFYHHGGFSVWAIFRTAVTNVLFNKKAGGSTLTQQLVKNAILTSEKKYTRKIKEAILAYRLEKKFSKDEILKMYLNEIPYGSNAYGVEAASTLYFGKSVKDITLPEAAILAALPQGPSRYSPFGPNKDLLIARQHYILDQMAKQGYITKEEAVVAKNTELKFSKKIDKIVAPHFVMYLKEILADKYGDKMVEQGGLKIYTTLDLDKQLIAEQVVKERTKENEKRYNASNAALVSLDPKTGQVLALVGSRDYFDEKIDGAVNVAVKPRQPGSSLKPLAYAAAFLKGYNPNTILYDVVTNFSTDPANSYEPRNYNGKEYGPISMKKALAGSLNTPAVKTLYLAGIDNVIKLAKKFGYTTLDEKDRFGLSLVLGGGEVKLVEHTNAYSAFAREGKINDLAFILEIKDKNNNVLEKYEKKERNVLDANVARMINYSLSDNNNRSYIFGEKNYLTLGSRPVAAKTGTTNNFRDAWTIGYTPSIVTGVWVGNSDNKPMRSGSDGSVLAAPIWNDYMKKVLGNTPVETFNYPEIKKSGKSVIDGDNFGEVKVKIDKASGLLATDKTPQNFVEEKTFKQVHDILYYVDKNDPLGDVPRNPGNDPQFSLWESRVQAWAVKQKISTSTPPTEYDNVHVDENKPTMQVNGLSDEQTITSPNINITIDATAPRGINRVEYYVNNNLFYSNPSYPFGLNKSLAILDNGLHELKVRACDDIDNCSEQTFSINLKLNNSKKTSSQISLSWANPANNQKFKIKDLPIKLKLNIINPEDVASVKILRKDNQQLIKTFNLVNGNIIETDWKPSDQANNFSFQAEATNWSGQVFQSEVINISIQTDVKKN